MRFGELWHQVLKYLRENEFEGRLAGVSTLEVSIIDILSQNPDLIIKQLNERLNVPASTLTYAIGRLEKRGFVKRVITPIDLRSFGLKLTEEGKKAQEEHLVQERLSFESTLRTLDDDGEREMFLKLMEKIVRRLMK